jgi:hypothetical protein
VGGRRLQQQGSGGGDGLTNEEAYNGLRDVLNNNDNDAIRAFLQQSGFDPFEVNVEPFFR